MSVDLPVSNTPTDVADDSVLTISARNVSNIPYMLITIALDGYVTEEQ